MSDSISCVMPTTARRAWCIPWAIEYYLAQTHKDSELIIVSEDAIEFPDHARVRYVHCDDDLPLGAKFNACVEAARYPLIALWADDDWQAPRRLRYELKALNEQPGAEIAGLRGMLFHRMGTNRTWIYRTPKPAETPYFLGGSLLFRRCYWERHKFDDGARRSADSSFTNGISPEEYARVAVVLDDPEFYIATIHGDCTGRSDCDPSGPGWSRWPVGVGAMVGDPVVASRYTEPR
jgi:glycosyltransferase involved in cell wall biosynthesis